MSGNIFNPRVPTDYAMLEKYQAMREVYSLSCVVSDAQARCNTMTVDIKPRSIPSQKIIGTAFTVQLSPGNLCDYLDVFNYLEKGDVIVVDTLGEKETSVFGGMMAGLALAAGCEGAVVDGSVRDTDEMRMLGFSIFSRYVGPRSAHSPVTGKYEPMIFNTPISCGGVCVNPGDLIIADEIGVTVVPRGDMVAVYERAAKQAEAEENTRRDILAGWGVDELLKKYGRL